MNIIFLDIDGVIQSPRYCVAINETGWLSAFEPAAMHMVQRLVLDAKAKIVISSSWRIGSTDRQLKQLFRCCGFKAIANSFHDDWQTKQINGFCTRRGNEIAEWLNRHPEIENYLILDDDADMLAEQMNNFVKTDPMNGLLLQHYDASRKILGLDGDVNG
ncbi:HAD domain-containing protein [Flavobacterium sp.]|jgi:hypothetical protein|uniref:HAD domain-containing protein n=1 Tax=Flavobacterium sp. TaxID=239 RepID=UPI0037BF4FCA